MKRVAAMAATAFLVACGGGGGGEASGQKELAANACDEYAKGQLGDKAYELDKAALAASMTPGADGAMSLKGPIVIEPGHSNESKQTLECSVRFVPGAETPDVLRMQFIWQ